VLLVSLKSTQRVAFYGDDWEMLSLESSLSLKIQNKFFWSSHLGPRAQAKPHTSTM
jgi:hypothetical protein